MLGGAPLNFPVYLQGRLSDRQWRGAPLDFRLLQGDGHEISGQCQEAVRSFLHEHLS